MRVRNLDSSNKRSSRSINLFAKSQSSCFLTFAISRRLIHVSSCGSIPEFARFVRISRYLLRRLASQRGIYHSQHRATSRSINGHREASNHCEEFSETGNGAIFWEMRNSLHNCVKLSASMTSRVWLATVSTDRVEFLGHQFGSWTLHVLACVAKSSDRLLSHSINWQVRIAISAFSSRNQYSYRIVFVRTSFLNAYISWTM